MLNWVDYIRMFHSERPGVADKVLQRSVAGHHTPYTWLARTVSNRASVVLDVASGAGTLSRTLARPGRTVIGVDFSPAEVRTAVEWTPADHQSPPLFALADGRALPVADASVDAVTSMLGLAVIHPLDVWLKEVSRVLKPGGMFAALTPTVAPLNANDLRVAGSMLRLLRGIPQFPVSIELLSGPVLAAAGLRKLEDNRERYRYPVRSRADADLLLSALYLSDAAGDRRDAASDWLARQVSRHGEVQVPIPMRRIVAMKTTAPRT